MAGLVYICMHAKLIASNINLYLHKINPLYKALDNCPRDLGPPNPPPSPTISTNIYTITHARHRQQQ